MFYLGLTQKIDPVEREKYGPEREREKGGPLKGRCPGQRIWARIARNSRYKVSFLIPAWNGR